jgi:hypothetical protein
LTLELVSRTIRPYSGRQSERGEHLHSVCEPVTSETGVRTDAYVVDTKGTSDLVPAIGTTMR